MIIAIDGPAASGKGTLAHRIADTLKFACLDTGLLYRAVGLGVLKKGGNPENEEDAVKAAKALHLEDHHLSRFKDPLLRGEDASRASSQVAAIPEVRRILLDFQRHFAHHPPGKAKGAVLDGRDIGTFVCPEADVKIFVTATVEIRAQRRLKDLQSRGIPAIYEAVLEDLKSRDLRDSTRALAPLKQAEDAFVLDTSAMNADQAYEKAMTAVRSKIGAKL